MLSQVPAERASVLAHPDAERHPAPSPRTGARTALRPEDVGRSKSGWAPEPAATGGDVQWSNPAIRSHFINALNNPHGAFCHVDGRARQVMKNFAHHRNPRTGSITPGIARIAYEQAMSPRAVHYALGRLDTGPSCQRDGTIVEGLGLVYRDARWNPYGGQTSNGYGFTCKTLIMADLALPHDPADCTVCQQERAVLAARRARAARRGRPRRPVAATLPLPGMPLEPAVRAEAAPPPSEPVCRAEAAPPPSEPAMAPSAPDPDFAVFAAVFAAERGAKYGNQRGGMARPDRRAAIGAMVLDLTAEACAWALGRGLELDRGAVREDLCRRMVRTWLTWAGTADYLITRPDPHPMGLIAGDLAGLGAEALTAWKRSQPHPKRVRVEPAEAPPAGEAWPELDTSEPEAGELAQMRAELGVPAAMPAPAPPPAEWFALMAKLGPSKPVPPPAPVPTHEELALLRAKQAEIRERALALLSSPEGEAPRLRTRLGLRSRPLGSESAPGSESVPSESVPGSESKRAKIRLRRPSQAWPHKRRVPEPAEPAPTTMDDGSGEQGDGDP